LYQCFGTWLTLGSFPPQVVAESKLLKLAFETLVTLWIILFSRSKYICVFPYLFCFSDFI